MLCVVYGILTVRLFCLFLLEIEMIEMMIIISIPQKMAEKTVCAFMREKCVISECP